MIQTGLFPLTGLLVGLSLYALYVWLLRLKVGSRWAQSFIALFYGRAYRDSLSNGLDADLLKRQMLQLYEVIALK